MAPHTASSLARDSFGFDAMYSRTDVSFFAAFFAMLFWSALWTILGGMIRLARVEERASLEALQWRASLANPGDRDALLENPDAIAIPVEQISAGDMFVIDRDGAIAGFAAIVMREDG